MKLETYRHRGFLQWQNWMLESELHPLIYFDRIDGSFYAINDHFVILNECDGDHEYNEQQKNGAKLCVVDSLTEKYHDVTKLFYMFESLPETTISYEGIRLLSLEKHCKVSLNDKHLAHVGQKFIQMKYLMLVLKCLKDSNDTFKMYVSDSDKCPIMVQTNAGKAIISQLTGYHDLNSPLIVNLDKIAQGGAIIEQ